MPTSVLNLSHVLKPSLSKQTEQLSHQIVLQTCKKGKQKRVSEQRSVYSNAIIVCMSCTPKLMKLQAHVKLFSLKSFTQLRSNILDLSNIGALTLWITQ